MWAPLAIDVRVTSATNRNTRGLERSAGSEPLPPAILGMVVVLQAGREQIDVAAQQ